MADQDRQAAAAVRRPAAARLRSGRQALGAGQRKCELGADSRRAFQSHVASHGSCEPPGNRKAETGAPFSRIGTLESLEEVLISADLVEIRIADTGMVNKYCMFVLEVVKAWIDPAVKNPHTIHHRGHGSFAVDGEMIKLKSKMK